MHAEAEVIELMLLRQKSVRDELKIDQEAAKQIMEFTHKQHGTATETVALPESDQKAKWEAMIKENEEFLDKALNADQRKRLKQIAMQTAGVLCVTAPHIAQELNLTDEQKKAAKLLQNTMQTEVAQAIEAKDKQARDQKLAELRKDSHEKLASLLTDDQQKKWKELVGEPFQGKLIYEDPEKQ
jgi:hypothetical protein